MEDAVKMSQQLIQKYHHKASDKEGASAQMCEIFIDNRSLPQLALDKVYLSAKNNL